MHSGFAVLNGVRGRRQSKKTRYTQASNHAIERAFAGAQALRDGLLGVDSPAKAAKTFCVAIGYINAAGVVLAAEDPQLLNDVMSRKKSLLAAATTARWRAKMLTAMREATPADLAKFGQAVGVDFVFDNMIVPSL